MALLYSFARLRGAPAPTNAVWSSMMLSVVLCTKEAGGALVDPSSLSTISSSDVLMLVHNMLIINIQCIYT